VGELKESIVHWVYRRELLMKFEKGASMKQLIAGTSTILSYSRAIWIRSMIPVVETLLLIFNITVRLSFSPSLLLQPHWLFEKEKRQKPCSHIMFVKMYDIHRTNKLKRSSGM
jgi:hypothetical protein